MGEAERLKSLEEVLLVTVRGGGGGRLMSVEGVVVGRVKVPPQDD